MGKKTTTFPVIDLAKTGCRIEKQRRKAGLTVRELQAHFGFEYPQAIYKWQHGECLPSVDNLLALARLLKVHMEDLLVYEDQEVFHVYGETQATLLINRIILLSVDMQKRIRKWRLWLIFISVILISVMRTFFIQGHNFIQSKR